MVISRASEILNGMTDLNHSFQPPSDPSQVDFAEKDPIFQQQVQRLHRLTVYGRWLTVGFMWLSIAPISLWMLRAEIALWLDYFTWTAVRYTILYNRFAAIGLILCIAATVAVLVWQSRNILWGIPAAHQKYLEKQVLRIRRQGKSHPLWRWVCES
jgi:hypothetical protein